MLFARHELLQVWLFHRVVVVLVVVVVSANEEGEYNVEFRVERPGYDFYSSRNSCVYRDVQND